MMRSMYSGVSGLRTHQSKMDVIGNNIANVNTVGFKRGQMTFQEVFNQVIQGASAPQGGKGGTNPQQVGMGVSVGSINTIHTKGPAQRTENPTDLMIDGEGFFVVSDDPNFGNRYYTRAGNFSLDRDGNLVTADGFKVLGYRADENGKITSDIANIMISKSETKGATATENIIIKGNLDSRLENDTEHKADTEIVDSLGNTYTVTFKFIKNDTGQWRMTIDRITDNATKNYYKHEDSGTVGIDGADGIDITFDKNGNIETIGGKNLKGDTNLLEKINLTNLNDIVFNYDKDDEEITDAKGPNGNLKDITLFDKENENTYKDLHQYANEIDAKPYKQDGETSGKIEGFSIDGAGNIVGSFSNGEKKILGQVMVAKFDNPMGLQKMGSNFFIDTRNSGEPQLGKAGANGYGAINAGNLEMSNVDISLEFTEMITTQRGFQANSRIITASDEMLQELVNIKR